MREVPDTLTIQDAMVDVAQGNPGALTILIGLAQAERYDLILYLYKAELKGSDLWILYKDENNEDLEQLIGDLELKDMTA